MMKVKTIGFPCSLSNGGYLTNDIDLMLEYCKRIRGAKLILNVEPVRYSCTQGIMSAADVQRQINSSSGSQSKDIVPVLEEDAVSSKMEPGDCETALPVRIRGMGFGETLPDCVLYLHKEHTSLEAYIGSLRSSYRRRIRLAQKRCAGLKVCYDDPKYDFYPLYLNTYNRSEYKLECLKREFFDRCEGTRIVFVEEDSDKAVGFVLLHEIPAGEEHAPGKLIFMFCGMDYDASCTNADLYYFMLLHIVSYAIDRGIRTIDLGQTSELTKLKFGAVLEKRYFYAHHTNPILNPVAVLGRGLLEYKYSFPEFNVFLSGS